MQAKEFLIRADNVDLGTLYNLVCCLFSVIYTKTNNENHYKGRDKIRNE